MTDEQPMPLYPCLDTELRSDILWVWLARPEIHNAFNAEMIDSLRRCFTDAAATPQVRAVVLSGRGSSFCAGADLNWMKASLDWTWEENLADARGLAAMLEAIEGCPRPVIARVNGSAFGGGVGVIAACDLAVSVRDARFGFSEVRLGIAPAVVSPFVVRKIGRGHARALFVTGRRFDAARAQEIGLVHEVVSAEDLDRAVEDVAGQIRHAGPRAVEVAKALALGVPDLDAETARRFTAEQIATLRSSEEGQEGIRAFLERREPRWVPE